MLLGWQVEYSSDGKGDKMKVFSLKRMKRKELLEMLLNQTKYVKMLEDENESLKGQVAGLIREPEIPGSIAEESLRISGVFEAAQMAADHYLADIKKKYPTDPLELIDDSQQNTSEH